jgi:nicotinate-nucleotide--dimethylbenzimidazole phosphoribosyltransferase
MSDTPSANLSAMPFDDIRALVQNLPKGDEAAVAAAQERDAQLTKPAGSLGRLEEIALWLARWQAGPSGKKVAVTRPLVAIFAGNHGVTERGISPFPASVTQAMVDNFAAGGAAINQICLTHDLGLKIFDLALEIPTADITKEAALDERACAATIAFGMEAIAGGTDLLCIGEMGIGNTTIAAAIYCALFGGEPTDWVGPGTGHAPEGVALKAQVVGEAMELHKAHLHDPLEVLRRVGGREIAAMAGAILAARVEGIPVLIDGFVAGAAAAVLYKLKRESLDHCLFAHVSAEPAHKRALDAMNAKPLVDLGMRLGEGTGAALAAGIVRSAAACHSGMATFAEAGVATAD